MPALSPRQLEILRLVAKGFNNDEIARMRVDRIHCPSFRQTHSPDSQVIVPSSATETGRRKSIVWLTATCP